jgi:hypothetical protein
LNVAISRSRKWAINSSRVSDAPGRKATTAHTRSPRLQPDSSPKTTRQKCTTCGPPLSYPKFPYIFLPLLEINYHDQMYLEYLNNNARNQMV